jgi:hypothetical protein
MAWSITIGTVKGTVIPLHITFLLFLLNGGRVLRAFLAHRLGHARGTQIAASVGQAAAFLFGLLALLGGKPLLVFIALSTSPPRRSRTRRRGASFRAE